ncbi:hypothetical protein BJV74DRAFT_882769 [Russula compacta]|nr:hypothetical protein BJV74DRAFT_882769 [Russula compacta]
MPPLFPALLAYILPPKGPSHGPSLQPDQTDPEKGGPSGSRDSQENNDDGDDHDQEIDPDDFEEQGAADLAEGMEDDLHSGRGVPMTSTGTMSSTSSQPFTRPSLPQWLVKVKDLLFASHPDHHDEFLPHYRTAPIISGTLIPFSILLGIPGLTEHWYVRTQDHEIVQARRNPPLVNASLAISMALGVLANIALIYRFLERGVKRSTIICIVSLTLHDILNVVTIVAFGVQHRFHDGFTNGEAFWMTICSTVVSALTNLTLIWDFVTTPNFDRSGSGITRKQRSLVIITMIFLTYIALGALISSLMMSLTYLNGLFFSIVTTLTIGFGDIVPITTAQRVVVCLYAVLGIIILGAGIRVTSEAILEGLQVGYRRRLQEYKRRRRARKRERELVRRWRIAVEERLVERGLDVWTPDRPGLTSPAPNVRPATLRRGSKLVPQAVYLNTEALPPAVLEEAAREAGVPPEKFIGRKFGRRARQQNYAHHHHHYDHQQQQGKEGEQRGRVPMDLTWTIDDGRVQESKGWGELWDRACQMLRLANADEDAPISQKDPSENLTYHEMVKILEKEERLSLYTKLGLAWAMFFLFWTIGSLIFSNTEGWGYGAAMYFCFIAFTTIGYGDLAPETPLGRAIFIFWALFGVGAMTILIAVVTDAFSSKYRSVTQDKKFDRAVRRYRQGQEKAAGKKAGEIGVLRNRRTSQVVPVLRANLARISSRETGRPPSCSAPKSAKTLAEAEECLRARTELLPAMILREVFRLRDHTRYFLIANGHADALHPNLLPQNTALPMPMENAVPDGLKQLLDEIAHEEGFEERLKQEVWDDAHARNTLFLLSLEKGAQKMVEAAELALETIAERNQLLTTEEEDHGIEVKEPADVQAEAKEDVTQSNGRGR